jgi:hypothetical protein
MAILDDGSDPDFCLASKLVFRVHLRADFRRAENDHTGETLGTKDQTKSGGSLDNVDGLQLAHLRKCLRHGGGNVWTHRP